MPCDAGRVHVARMDRHKCRRRRPSACSVGRGWPLRRCAAAPHSALRRVPCGSGPPASTLDAEYPRAYSSTARRPFAKRATYAVAVPFLTGPARAGRLASIMPSRAASACRISPRKSRCRREWHAGMLPLRHDVILSCSCHCAAGDCCRTLSSRSCTSTCMQRCCSSRRALAAATNNVQLAIGGVGGQQALYSSRPALRVGIRQRARGRVSYQWLPRRWAGIPL